MAFDQLQQQQKHCQSLEFLWYQQKEEDFLPQEDFSNFFTERKSRSFIKNFAILFFFSVRNYVCSFLY